MRATRIVFKKSCRAVLSHVQLFATPWTITLQAPLSMGFSLQENWSGMPFPPSGDLPDPGVKPTSPASHALAGGFFTIEPLGKPSRNHNSISLSLGDFPIAQMVKNLPAMQETLVWRTIISSVQFSRPFQISRTSALLKCICLSFILFSLTFPPPSLCLSFLTHFLILIIYNSGSYL